MFCKNEMPNLVRHDVFGSVAVISTEREKTKKGFLNHFAHFEMRQKHNKKATFLSGFFVF